MGLYLPRRFGFSDAVNNTTDNERKTHDDVSELESLVLGRE
jgi:hypothetical protein